jgi:hypothetical protein
MRTIRLISIFRLFTFFLIACAALFGRPIPTETRQPQNRPSSGIVTLNNRRPIVSEPNPDGSPAPAAPDVNNNIARLPSLSLAPTSFRAASAGALAGDFPFQYGFAKFFKNGILFYEKNGGGGGGRGFNIAAIDPSNGELLHPVQNFDTWLSRFTGEAMSAMVGFLNSLPNGTVILIAVGDEAGLVVAPGECVPLSFPWVEAGYQALESLGSQKIRQYCYWDSWAMVTIKGEGWAQAEQLGVNAQVSAQTTIQIGGCAFSINPVNENFGAAGGNSSVNVSSGAGCVWTATAHASWITITSSLSGGGNGTINYSVAANVGPARTGAMSIANQTFNITQASGCEAISLSPTTIASGTVDTAYSRSFNASGGAPPYSFSIIAGLLPFGLNLSSAGVISGAPSSSGIYNFTLRATDSNGCFDERAYALVISGPGLSGLQYYPLPVPVRLLDTRQGENACHTPNAPLGDNAVRLQQAWGSCSGIPANALAIVANATVVNFVSGGGYITLYPSSAARPNASNLNFTVSHIVPNSITVGLGNDGAFNIYSSAATDFIIDITGYYAPPSAVGLYYHPLPAPLRLLDTRQGQAACDNPGAPLANNGIRTVTAHRACLGRTIPSSAKAIVGNATVVNFISGGFNYITLYPFGNSQPNASNLNFTANQIVPNAFTAGLSSDGKFNIFSSGATDFIVDVAGYYSDDAVDANGQGLLFKPLPTPVRLLDTRPNQQACEAPAAPLGNDATLTLLAQRTCLGVTAPNTAKAMVGNGTVVNLISTGFHWITLYPFGAALPTASNLNFTLNQIVPNAFVVGLSNDGKFNVYSHASTDFIVDLTGYFEP